MELAHPLLSGVLCGRSWLLALVVLGLPGDAVDVFASGQCDPEVDAGRAAVPVAEADGGRRTVLEDGDGGQAALAGVRDVLDRVARPESPTVVQALADAAESGEPLVVPVVDLADVEVAELGEFVGQFGRGGVEVLPEPLLEVGEALTPGVL